MLKDFKEEDLALLMDSDLKKITGRRTGDIEHRLDGCKVEDLGALSQMLANEYGANGIIKVELEYDCGDTYLKAELEYDHIESDQEQKTRLQYLIGDIKRFKASETKRKKNKIAQEKRDLVRLTKKYGVPKDGKGCIVEKDLGPKKKTINL